MCDSKYMIEYGIAFKYTYVGIILHSMYYKPMGDLPYISSEQGGLIMHTELIYEYTVYKRPIQEL